MSLSEGFGHALKGVVIGCTAASSSSVAKCHEGAWLSPIFHCLMPLLHLQLLLAAHL